MARRKGEPLGWCELSITYGGGPAPDENGERTFSTRLKVIDAVNLDTNEILGELLVPTLRAALDGHPCLERLSDDMPNATLLGVRLW